MVGLLTGVTSSTVNPSTAADRITKLLTDQKPSLDEFFNSAIEASTGKTTFGEQLNASRASSIAEAQSLYDVLSKERSAGLDQRKFELEVQKAEAAAEQEAATAGRETFRNFITDFKDMYAGADPKRKFEAYQYLNTLGVDENSSPEELHTALNDIAAKFGFVPPPEQPQPGFTLSPGQQRFDAEGNPIAGLPAAPKGPEFGTPVGATPNVDIPYDGGVLPKGSPITITPVAGTGTSITSVNGKQVVIDDSKLARVNIQGENPIGTPAQRAAAEAKVQFFDSAVNATEKLMKDIETGLPTGAAQTFVDALQGTMDQITTLAQTVPELQSATDVVASARSMVDRIGIEGEDPSEITGVLFDPRLPALEVIQEGLAVALAASSFPSDQRIPVEAIRAARQNVDLTGILGPGQETALARLRAVRDRLSSARNNAASLASGGQPPAPQAPSSDLPVWEIDSKTGKLVRVQ